MKKQPTFNKKNVRFHHRREYGISVGIGTDADDNMFVALASCRRPGKLKKIAHRRSDGSMHTIPWDPKTGDQYIKEEARNSILIKMNVVNTHQDEEFNNYNVHKVGKLSIDTMDAIKIVVSSLDLDLDTVEFLSRGVTRKEFADTAFGSIVAALNVHSVSNFPCFSSSESNSTPE